jgi:hypothetical protein
VKAANTRTEPSTWKVAGCKYRRSAMRFRPGSVSVGRGVDAWHYRRRNPTVDHAMHGIRITHFSKSLELRLWDVLVQCSQAELDEVEYYARLDCVCKLLCNVRKVHRHSSSMQTFGVCPLTVASTKSQSSTLQSLACHRIHVRMKEHVQTKASTMAVMTTMRPRLSSAVIK